MQLFSLATVCIYSLISLWVGIKLLRQSQRTRRGAELLVGLGFLAGGMVGYPFTIVGTVIWSSSSHEFARFAYGVGQIGMASAAIIVLGAWQVVFAPHSRWAQAFLWGWSATLSALMLVCLDATVPDASRFGSFPYSLLMFCQGVCYAVIATATIHHGARLRKREALGLSDPVVTNRMLLWGVTESAVTLQYLLTLTSMLLARLGLHGIYDPAIVAILGLIAAGASYVAFVTRRAGAGWMRSAPLGGLSHG